MDAQGGNSCPVAIDFPYEVRDKGYLQVKALGWGVGVFQHSREALGQAALRVPEKMAGEFSSVESPAQVGA